MEGATRDSNVFSTDGEPLPVAEGQSGWRVHQASSRKGKVAVGRFVADPEAPGPLYVELGDDDPESLAALGLDPGEYALVPVDSYGKAIAGAPPGVVQIRKGDARNFADLASQNPLAAVAASNAQALAAAVQSNAQMAGKFADAVAALFAGLAGRVKPNEATATAQTDEPLPVGLEIAANAIEGFAGALGKSLVEKMGGNKPQGTG